MDVSGLAQQCYGLDALKQLVDEDAQRTDGQVNGGKPRDEFVRLAEILSEDELETVRQRGGHMHRPRPDGDQVRRTNGRSTPTAHERGGHDGTASSTSGNWARERVVLQDPESPEREIERPLGPSGGPGGGGPTAATLAARHNGRLAGVYEHYLLVRPYPSLRILFTSPLMRVPGILQSPLMDRIGGSPRMRDDFVQALAHGRGVTAKVKWLNVSHSHSQQQAAASKMQRARPKRTGPDTARHPLEAHLEPDDYGIDDGDGEIADPEPTGRARWLHCTPLVGANGKVGVWMIVIVDDEAEMRLRGGGGGGVPEGKAHAASPAPRPPAIVADGPGAPAVAPPHPSYLRPRRSSETLGSAPPSEAEFPTRDDSLTQAIHKRAGAGGLRTHPLRSHPHAAPAQGTAKNGTAAAGLPTSFFSLAALARGARTKPRAPSSQAPSSPPAKPPPPPGAVTSPPRREQGVSLVPLEGRRGQGPRAETFYAQSSSSSVTAAASEHDVASSRVVYIPPAIDERASERGSRWDTASLQSQDTVNIEG